MGTMLVVLTERKPDALGPEPSHRRRWHYCAQQAFTTATASHPTTLGSPDEVLAPYRQVHHGAPRAAPPEP
jgi:hypothetical protein